MKTILLLTLLAFTGCTTTVSKPHIKEVRSPDGTVTREITAEYLKGPALNTFKPFPQ